jgi:electron transfer flavoprotein alpha subunit
MMTNTLVWVEHEGGAVKDATLSAVTAAAQIGTVTALVAGQASMACRCRADRGRCQGAGGR